MKKILEIYSKTRSAMRFLKSVDIAPMSFLVITLFSLGMALFEGLSLGLLVPLGRGLVERDFGFMSSLPYFHKLLSLFPALPVHSKHKMFLVLAVIFFVSSVSKKIIQYCASLYANSRRHKFSSNLKKLIFNRFLSFGKLFFDRQNAGYLNQVLSGVTNRVTNTLNQIQSLINNVILLAMYLVMMFLISKPLTLLSLLLFPVLYFALRSLITKIRTMALEGMKMDLERHKTIHNLLASIPLVKAYAQEEEEKIRFAKASDAIAQMNFEISRKQNLIGPLQEILTLVALMCLMVAALPLMHSQGQPLSNYFVFFVIVRRALPIFGSLNASRSFFAKLEAPLKELAKVLDDQDKFFVVAGKRKFEGIQNKIEFNHLNFSYLEDIPVLKDVSFTLEQGKTTALVGPSGSGKTTLMHLLLRFYDCHPCEITIDGMDIREFEMRSLKSRMVLVSQTPLLFNDTLRANMAYGLNGKASEEKLIQAAEKARIRDFIQRLPDGFETLIGDRGVKLSGGEKQRVSIARAILKEADILLLDEATSSLDSKTEKLIQEAIYDVMKGRTSLVIAHRLSTIRNADKIVVIENGSVAEIGSLEELLSKRGKFYELWEAQKFY